METVEAAFRIVQCLRGFRVVVVVCKSKVQIALPVVAVCRPLKQRGCDEGCGGEGDEQGGDDQPSVCLFLGEEFGIAFFCNRKAAGLNRYISFRKI